MLLKRRDELTRRIRGKRTKASKRQEMSKLAVAARSCTAARLDDFDDEPSECQIAKHLSESRADFCQISFDAVAGAENRHMRLEVPGAKRTLPSSAGGSAPK